MLVCMERTRLTGLVLMGLALLQALWFVLGLRRQSYAAVALPAAVLMLVLTGLIFWTGWTVAEMEDDLEGLEFAPEPLDDI